MDVSAELPIHHFPQYESLDLSNTNQLDSATIEQKF
jgi:hypothetical protein